MKSSCIRCVVVVVLAFGLTLLTYGCDGKKDEKDSKSSFNSGTSKYHFYQDLDGDGYGNRQERVYAESQPEGYVANHLDCDDTAPEINPGNDIALTSYGAFASPSIAASKRQWKYSETPGEPYEHDIKDATKDEYTPQFAEPGEYYVVCESKYEIAKDVYETLISNEVLIFVNDTNLQPEPFNNRPPDLHPIHSNSIYPRRSQIVKPGRIGDTLRVTRSPVVRFLFHPEIAETKAHKTDLTIDDIITRENGMEITCREHFKILKRGGIDYYQNIVLFLDVSNSITTNDLSEMKRAAQVLVDAMAPGEMMKLVSFDDSLNEMTGRYDEENPFLYHDFDTKDEIIDAQHINRMTVRNSSTDLYGAIIAAANRCNDAYGFSSVSQAFLILITDGADTAKTKTLSEALGKVSGKRVYTVGVGVDADTEVLEQLGTSDSFYIDHFSELTNQLREIKQLMIAYGENLYFLEYASPIRTEMVNLSITASRNCEPSEITSSFSADNFHSVSDLELYWVDNREAYCAN